jgi:outer membrane lipoprotein LolB
MMSQRFLRVAGAMAIATLLSACATLTTESDGLTYAERMQRIAGVTDWSLSGRISVDTGEDAYQGRFNWRQDSDEMRLVIRGPLGVGAVQIAGSDDSLTVHARGESWQMEDPEIELSELLGWWLPVTSLRYWLLGIPDARFADDGSVYSNELLEYLAQRAWRLRYTRYELSEDVLIPRSIELTHAPLALTVTIDDWRR